MNGLAICSDSTNRHFFRFVQRFAVLLLIAAGLFIAGGAWAATTAGGTAQATAVANCRKDLASRLHVQNTEIQTIDVQPKEWPDTALGQPEEDRLYAQVVTPGWRIVLEAKGIRYLYTASDRVCKFGGPLALWDYSTLYVEPVADEPNLNGDLYQSSMIGTNPVRLVSGVSSYYPQANGKIIFTRRTSRSGFDLYLMKAGEGDKAQLLDGAFSFGAAALNEAQDTWAAFVRPTLGTEWDVVVARVGQHEHDAITLPLPDDVRSQQIAWSGDKVMILVSKGNGTVCYETTPTAATPAWRAVDSTRFPGALDYMLNKSESLEISQTGTPAQPSVEVARVWFTGDRKVIATIDGLTLREDTLLGAGYAFIRGERGGETATYAVQIYTGEVTPGYHGADRDIKPFMFPPLHRP